jgi:predicted RNA binding protein YcfA (HicA-like mRNA interferase family)
MRLPRDVSGADLIRAFRSLGYEVTRQKGSHARVTTVRDGEHHETIPAHSPIKAGTLNSILKSVAARHGMSVEELCSELDL